MPTYDLIRTFTRDLKRLTDEQHRLFKVAVAGFVEDLIAMENGERDSFRAGLRVKRVVSAQGVFEMTWDGDGRATFHYGDEVSAGKRHIIWRRVGTHSILLRP